MIVTQPPYFKTLVPIFLCCYSASGIRELAMGASEGIKEDTDVLSYYR